VYEQELECIPISYISNFFLFPNFAISRENYFSIYSLAVSLHFYQTWNLMFILMFSFDRHGTVNNTSQKLLIDLKIEIWLNYYDWFVERAILLSNKTSSCFSLTGQKDSGHRKVCPAGLYDQPIAWVTVRTPSLRRSKYTLHIIGATLTPHTVDDISQRTAEQRQLWSVRDVTNSRPENRYHLQDIVNVRMRHLRLMTETSIHQVTSIWTLRSTDGFVHLYIQLHRLFTPSW
jgi:hypothetical protein